MKKFMLFCVVFLLFFSLFAEDDEKLKLAVMDLEDLSGKLSEDTLSGASEYFRVIFAQTNRYIIISKDRQKNQISDLRKKYNTDPSYKSCTDKNCQIQLGQALSADLIVKTSVSFFAGFYTLASELIDLEKEATIIAATEEYDGTPQALRTAIKNIVAKIVEAEKKENGEFVPSEQPLYREPQDQQASARSTDSKDCKTARKENSTAAWKNYLRKHSDGDCAEEAKEFLDKQTCAEAEKENTVKAWKKYLKEFKDGNCVSKAESNIKRIEQEEDARLAAEANSIHTKADDKLNGGLSKRFSFDIGLGTALYDEGEQLNFGMGLAFDFDWKVFSKPYGGGAGNLFIGFGFDFRYWILVEIAVPIQFNVGYEFKLNNSSLRYIGFWYSMGASLNFFHPQHDWLWESEDIDIFNAAFAYQLYFDMIFGSGFVLNAGMGGEVGSFTTRTVFILGIGCVF